MLERTDAIACTGVVKRFAGGRTVLDGLTFHVPAGSVFGYLGLNGAGKTTTIRILAGTMGFDAGEVTILGRKVSGRSPSLLREMGFVLDEPLTFDWMTAAEYLLHVGRLYGLEEKEGASRVAELLEFFDLDGAAGFPIASFSAGMRKKVAVSAALIHAPRLLVLDEPLEAVDAVAARDLKETLRMMTRNGATVFLTSHALDTVERLCDEVAILHDGTVSVTGSPQEIPARVPSADGHTLPLEDAFVELTAGTRVMRPLSFLP
jgi:ABC-2 type transport system ATP-binding protein